MLSKQFIERVQNKIARESYRTLKRFYHRKNRNDSKKRILFVVGCQRSGTTLMMHILEKDYATSIYHEHSTLSSADRVERLRLNSLDSVKQVLSRDMANFIVLKPLVESQHTVSLLNHIPNSKALWMYRTYQDVVSSNLMRFGTNNGIDDIRPIATGIPNNWRSEGVSDHIRSVIQEHFSEDMNPHDAGALFWYARNILYFEQNLEYSQSVMLCNYRDLALKPLSFMKELYRFMEQDFPGSYIIKDVKDSSLGRGKDVSLTPAIDELCNSLYERLNSTYAATEQYCRIHANDTNKTVDVTIAV